jgi:hypothetical protein
MGAIHGYDGWDGLAGTGGRWRPEGPIEVEEWETPYRWIKHEFITDSAVMDNAGGLACIWKCSTNMTAPCGIPMTAWS